MAEWWYGLIPVLVLAALLLVDGLYKRRRSAQQNSLLERGVKTCGEVCHVNYEWVGRKRPKKRYELCAKFECRGKTHYALQKCSFKPDFLPGDPIGICFDPDDPDKNMILDFPDSRIEI